MSQPPAMHVGAQMWAQLISTFHAVAHDHDAATGRALAQLYTGFISAACGSMAGDVGHDAALAVLRGVLEAVAGHQALREAEGQPRH